MGPSFSTLVTSATGGVGLHLAEAFAADGHRLVLLASDRHELDRVAAQLRRDFGVEVDVIAAELGQPMAVDHVLAALDGQRIDVLVNSFGPSQLGVFWEVPLEHHLATLRVSIEAVIHLTSRLLPAMVERNRGGLLNLACFGNSEPGAMTAVHHACKAFMRSWSAALAAELAHTQLRVITVCRDDSAGHGPAATPNTSVIPWGQRVTPRELATIGFRAFVGGGHSALDGNGDETVCGEPPGPWRRWFGDARQQDERGEADRPCGTAESLASVS
jgi:uncharacterized protein